MQINAVVITISDGCWRKEREDKSGPAVEAELNALGVTIIGKEIIPDESVVIEEKLIHYSSLKNVNLIVTTGGTGISPRDNTPEATRAVIEKDIPGLIELMRLESFKSTPRAALTRAVAGIRTNTLIINLPGSVKGAQECLKAIASVLPHAVDLIEGRTAHD